MGRVSLCTQHHAVLSLERSLSISAVGYLHSSVFRFCFCRQLCQGLYCLRAYFCTYIVYCSVRNVTLSTDHCFSMLQHATHTIVVLDTAWPWASEAYGLCACAHTFVRINLYAQDHMALSFCRSLLQACYKVNSDATKSIVTLDTAGPWANDTYGLCCLRAYFCAHRLIAQDHTLLFPK